MKEPTVVKGKEEAVKGGATTTPKKKSGLKRALTILMYTWPLVLILIIALIITISVLVNR